jgi:FemAB-related protein (PEP-CTERM system-associated)
LAQAEEWDAYVGGSATASLYHLHGWKEVIEQTFGHRTMYLAARSRSSALVGVLPLTELKSRLFGRMVVSLPFFNYGGICAGDDAARSTLLSAAIDLARDRRADFLELRHESPLSLDTPVKTTKVAMRLELPESSQKLWQGIGSKLRNQVQRPKKDSMTSVVGGSELIDDFYSVFAANMRDLGTPVYSKAFFRNIMRRFPDRTWIAAVYKDRMPIASGFLAGFRDQLEIPWASSLRQFNRSSPNMLMYWSCLEFACDQGYRIFDFGRSTTGGGTFRFKEQWGARPHQLYWHYWLPDGRPLPEVNPANPKYQAAIAVWRRLPLGITCRLGPSIVKYIP